MVTTAAMSEMQDIITLVVGHCVRVSWTAASPKWSTSSCEDIVKKREKKRQGQGRTNWNSTLEVGFH